MQTQILPGIGLLLLEPCLWIATLIRAMPSVRNSFCSVASPSPDSGFKTCISSIQVFLPAVVADPSLLTWSFAQRPTLHHHLRRPLTSCCPFICGAHLPALETLLLLALPTRPLWSIIASGSLVATMENRCLMMCMSWTWSNFDGHIPLALVLLRRHELATLPQSLEASSSYSEVVPLMVRAISSSFLTPNRLFGRSRL